MAATKCANFLVNSALFWLEKYHIDGIRVDAVASMLYLDYSRKEGEWIPNMYGGRENLEAISFLRRFNEQVYLRFPEVQTFAEESTAWPSVSRPTYLGGLGFGFKWDMGWMHDSLKYMAEDPVHRKYHHNQLTFRSVYAYSENFIMPLSHDEVVHGKRSLLEKMPGDDWQKLANLRLLLGYMYSQPGKKLLFMGGEFGQRREWNHDMSLDWHLLNEPGHRGIARWIGDLNHAYRSEPALHAKDCDPSGFRWVEANDAGPKYPFLHSRLGFENDPAHPRGCRARHRDLPRPQSRSRMSKRSGAEPSASFRRPTTPHHCRSWGSWASTPTCRPCSRRRPAARTATT